MTNALPYGDPETFAGVKEHGADVFVVWPENWKSSVDTVVG